MDPQYEVEEIIQERTYQSKGQSITEYKVKWKGYALKDATWQPIKNLQGCLEKLNDFKSKSKKEKSPQKQKKGTKKIVNQRKKNTNKPTDNIFVATTSNNQLYFSDQSNDAPLLQPPTNIKPVNKTVQATPKRSTTPKPKHSPIKNKKPPKIKVSKKLKIKLKKHKKIKKILKISGKYIKKNQADQERKRNTRQANQKLRQTIMQQFPTKTLKPLEQRNYTINIPKAQVKSQETQTTTNSNPSLTVKAIHYSHLNPSSLYFTVEQQGQYRQISRQALISQNPKALYNFYRSHYLKAKQQDALLKKSVKQILQGKSSIEKLNIDHDHNDQYNVHMKQIKKKQRPISVREWKQQFKKQLQSQKKGKPLSRRNRLMIADQSILSIQSYDQEFKFENDESYLDSSIADSSVEHDQSLP